MTRVQKVLGGKNRGHTDLRISLPVEWCKKHNIVHGDVVIIEEKENWLIIIPASVKPK